MPSLRSWLWCHLVACAVAANTSCDVAAKGFGPPFNASGTAPVNVGSETWYLTIGLTDTRNPSASPYPGTQAAVAYLSLPSNFTSSGGDTQLCAYGLPEQNKTAQGDNDSCQGVLSDSCSKYIQKFQGSVSFASGKCPELSNEACGDINSLSKLKNEAFFLSPLTPGPKDHIFIFYAADVPLNLTSDSCYPDGLPGVADIPQKYSTHALFGFGWSSGDGRIDSFKAYDAHVGQANPVLLVLGRRTGPDKNRDVTYNSQMLCVAPRHIATGSHDPKSSAIKPRVNRNLVLAAILTGLVLANLV